MPFANPVSLAAPSAVESRQPLLRADRPSVQPFHHPTDEDLSVGTPGREAGGTDSVIAVTRLAAKGKKAIPRGRDGLLPLNRELCRDLIN